jgi:hypothetical protein
MVSTTAFEPSRYLTKIGNSDYLEVKWRLVWLRHDHPEAMIETSLEQHSDSFALFRATVTLPTGGSATGWGSEQPGDFRDYIEKAETKAIGRALAALGYGTQFCPDFEFGASTGRVVDSPIDITRTRGWSGGRPDQADGPARVFATENPATERQLSFLQSVARAAGLDEEGLRREIRQETGSDRLELTRREASALIDRLKAASTELPVAS